MTFDRFAGGLSLTQSYLLPHLAADLKWCGDGFKGLPLSVDSECQLCCCAKEHQNGAQDVAQNSWERLPDEIKCAKSSGAPTPPANVPIP
jgi:hypothetical protein